MIFVCRAGVLGSLICRETVAGSNFQLAAPVLTVRSVRSSHFLHARRLYSNAEGNVSLNPSPSSTAAGVLRRRTMIRAPIQYRLLPPFKSRWRTRSVSTMPTTSGPKQVQHVTFVSPKNDRRWPARLRRAITLFVALSILIALERGPQRDSNQDAVESKTQEKIQETSDKVQLTSEPPSQEQEDAEESEELDPEDVWFIPFGWPRRKPPVQYKGTDEEWTEFIKFAKDQERMSKARGQAAGLIESLVEVNPTIVNLLGEPVRCTKHWLDIDFPGEYSDGYAVNGLVITDDAIGWGTKEFGEQTFDRFMRVLNPLPLLGVQWEITKTAFSGKDNLKMLTKEIKDLPVGVPGIPDLSSSPLIQQILQKGLQRWRRPPSRISIPRGCVMVSGRIDVTGVKHWATFVFLGFYDPKLDEWSGMPRINIGMIRPLQVTPKNGVRHAKDE